SSFSGAAEKLGVSKATVSRAIASLEKRVRAELVHRTTRQVALSTAGIALYERAAPHLASLKQAVCSLPEIEQGPSGELRITAPVDLGAALLPETIARFTLRHPSVRVDARITNRVVDLIGEGFDLAIRAAGPKLKDSSLVARPLSAVEAHLYASPTYLARRG